MKAWHAAALGGALGAGVVLAFGVRAKAKQFEAQGAALERAVPGSVAAQLEARLAAYADMRGNVIANQAADAYMRNVYGITAERVAAMDRLARAVTGR